MAEPIRIELAHEFRKNLAALAKRYRRIRSDLEPVLAQLAAGEQPGDRIAGTSGVVFKVRVRNSDVQKGKSGGYRLIYQVLDADSLVLLMIYSKSDYPDIPVADLRDLVEASERARLEGASVGDRPEETTGEPLHEEGAGQDV